MKTPVQLKKPYGKGTSSRIRNARYLGWEDAFDVEFEDGLCFLEPHRAIRHASHIAAKAVPVCVEVEKRAGQSLQGGLRHRGSSGSVVVVRQGVAAR
jgi:hypothetical protein